MNRLFLLWAVSVAIFAMPLSLGAQQPAQTKGIEIDVRGFRNNNGLLGCSLFNGPEGFPRNRSKVLMHQHVPIHDGHAECVFTGLPAGTYAVTIFHDENSNHEFDKNMLGYPLEGFGFSNNVKPTVRAPSFDEAAFQYDGASLKRIPIDMIYR
ncbi:MAG: hypothetical protein JWM69_1589 [Candidatus Binatus sp.]|jgi:uncharacterized protein (DUF2141 family)|nr:hypothetical protein [Candidatus Binatus sp.]